MRYRIVQCLCPQRHAIIAYAVNVPPAEMSDAEAIAGLRTVVEALVAGGAFGREVQRRLELPMAVLNPWCDLCQAPRTTWRYELAWSKPVDDWERAMSVLREMERQNLATNALIRSIVAQSRKN